MHIMKHLSKTMRMTAGEVRTCDILKSTLGGEMGGNLGAFLESLLNGTSPTEATEPCWAVPPNFGRSPKLLVVCHPVH